MVELSDPIKPCNWPPEFLLIPLEYRGYPLYRKIPPS
jgi:hypothetical protein